jgi:hypothetical protein
MMLSEIKERPILGLLGVVKVFRFFAFLVAFLGGVSSSGVTACSTADLTAWFWRGDDTY